MMIWQGGWRNIRGVLSHDLKVFCVCPDCRKHLEVSKHPFLCGWAAAWKERDLAVFWKNRCSKDCVFLVF